MEFRGILRLEGNWVEKIRSAWLSWREEIEAHGFLVENPIRALITLSVNFRTKRQWGVLQGRPFFVS